MLKLLKKKKLNIFKLKAAHSLGNIWSRVYGTVIMNFVDSSALFRVIGSKTVVE